MVSKVSFRRIARRLNFPWMSAQQDAVLDAANVIERNPAVWNGGKLLRPDGQAVDIDAMQGLVTDYGIPAVCTWGTKPGSGLTAGRSRIWVTDVGVSGSEWIWDGTHWVPVAPVVLAREGGNLVTPVATLNGVVSGTFRTIAVPAGMYVKPGAKLSCEALFKRSGANQTANVRFGGTSTATDIGAFTMGAVDGQQVWMQAAMVAVTPNAQLVTRTASINAITSNMQDRAFNGQAGFNLPIALDNAHISDSFSLMAYSLTLHP